MSECIQIMGSSFLLGSIPFGVVLAKAAKLPDPRTLGSGNIGATNMLRTGNKKIALLTLLLDGGKGALAVYLASLIYDAGFITGALAVLLSTAGHIYSPWLKFKGGKGVATTFGGVLMLYPPVGITLMLLWLLIFAVTRTSSLSSITALALLPIAAHLKLDPASAVVLSLAAGIVIFKHAANISRIVKGNEPTFTSKA